MLLYAATSNPGKLREFATCVRGVTLPGLEALDVRTLPNLASIPEPLEDAPTFLGNAELKAIAYSLTAPGLLVFADDSGLAVDALHGEPGVRSARFADDAGYPNTPNFPSVHLPHASSVIPSEAQRSEEPLYVAPVGTPLPAPSGPATPPLTKDARNNALLLARLAALPPNTPRTARFVCALALARDGHILLRAEGALEGEILPAPRGHNGFGYDPLFLIPSLNLTTAELPPEQKWALSHRGNAFRALLAQLPTLIP